MNLGDDDFTLFGLPQGFGLDRADLDQRWRKLQAEVHPDRFASEGAASQRVAMQWSVRVNEAYGRLKDPLQRAAYLCELRGAPINAENNTAMPASFLMQQMEWRESLDDAKGAAAIESIDAEVREAQDALVAELATLLAEQAGAEAAAQAAQRVRALMFVARFRDDIDRRLDALGQ